MERLRRQLRRQLGFLRQSCEGYDRGDQDEAIRIAVCIRVLLHDPKSSRPGRRQSRSILDQLSAKRIRLLSTVRDVGDWRFLPFFDGLTTLIPGRGPGPKLNSEGSGSVMFFPKHGGYVPPETRCPRQVPVQEWWEQVVYIVGPGKGYTRRDLVLTAADKDGGAHVDEELPPEYERVASLWKAVPLAPGAAVSHPQVHLIGLRQFGYEILHSEELIALAE
jgi:hypothetical protein